MEDFQETWFSQWFTRTLSDPFWNYWLAMMVHALAIVLLLSQPVSPLLAQDEPVEPPTIATFDPDSQLVVAKTLLSKPSFR